MMRTMECVTVEEREGSLTRQRNFAHITPTKGGEKRRQFLMRVYSPKGSIQFRF